MLKARVSITRSSLGRVHLRIKDVASGVEFAIVSMTVENFGNAVTGFACQEGDLEVRGLQWVGKTCVTEPRSIECPLDTHSRERLAQWLQANAQEDGWLLSTYLGSQSSIVRKNGVTTLNYHVTKYVDSGGSAS